MSRLFSPLQVRGVQLRNRVSLSPMQQYRAEAGCARPWHLMHLGARAAGGAGLVMTEATAVQVRGCSTTHDLGLWNDHQAEAMAPVARFVAEQGATFGVQLWHAGRKAPRRRPWEPRTPPPDPWRALGATGAAFAQGEPAPERASDDQLRAVVADFASAASRAHEAGARWLELHAGHGYLLHEFLSPLTNTRDDAWGGSVHGRSRLLLETVDAVREVWPEHLPLSVRLSVVDGPPDGWALGDTVDLLSKLRQGGVDVLVATAGGAVREAAAPPLQGEHHGLLPALREHAQGLTLGVVGGVGHARTAERLVADGGADLVAVARGMLRDPNWTLSAARELGPPIAAPVGHERAWA